MIIKKTDSKKAFVRKVLYPITDEVIKRLGNPHPGKITFLFTENPKKAFLDIADPERMYHGRRYDEMEYWISEIVSSFSLQDGKKIMIMINVKDPYIRNHDYATGLIAHELMHTIIKSRGIEPRISEIGGKQWPFIIKTLEKIGENYENVLNDLIKLVTFFILCMKDIIVDTILIENGFENEILIQKRMESSSSPKSIKVGKSNLASAMILEIGFNCMWIPLESRAVYTRKIKKPFKMPPFLEKECTKVVRELRDVKPGVKNHEKEIREAVITGLEAYRKLYGRV